MAGIWGPRLDLWMENISKKWKDEVSAIKCFVVRIIFGLCHICIHSCGNCVVFVNKLFITHFCRLPIAVRKTSTFAWVELNETQIHPPTNTFHLVNFVLLSIHALPLNCFHSALVFHLSKKETYIYTFLFVDVFSLCLDSLGSTTQIHTHWLSLLVGFWYISSIIIFICNLSSIRFRRFVAIFHIGISYCCHVSPYAVTTTIDYNICGLLEKIQLLQVVSIWYEGFNNNNTSNFRHCFRLMFMSMWHTACNIR